MLSEIHLLTDLGQEDQNQGLWSLQRLLPCAEPQTKAMGAEVSYTNGVNHPNKLLMATSVNVLY